METLPILHLALLAEPRAIEVPLQQMLMKRPWRNSCFSNRCKDQGLSEEFLIERSAHFAHCHSPSIKVG